MIILGILLSIVTIGFFCWLLFTLAVFALPFFVGVSAGAWAFHTGAGLAWRHRHRRPRAGLTFGAGQVLLAAVRQTWARSLVAFAFVAPAVLAGYHATHGIVLHLMPSGAWQTVFSVTGAIAVGATAFVRLVGMAAPGPSGQGRARDHRRRWRDRKRVSFDRPSSGIVAGQGGIGSRRRQRAQPPRGSA